jgi:hypothetical protein
VVERQVQVATGNLRALVLYVDHAAARILDDRLFAGAAGELLFVLQLEARQPVAVRADEPEDLRRHRSLWVGAVLLGIEAEPRELQPLQRGGLCRVRLARHVDEAVRTVGENREDPVGAHPERAFHRYRGTARIRDLHRVGVDGRRALAQRELEAAAVEHRPTAGGDGDRFPVLRKSKTRQRLGPHGLQPRRAYEQTRERESDRREKEPDPPVDEAVHRWLVP